MIAKRVSGLSRETWTWYRNEATREGSRGRLKNKTPLASAETRHYRTTKLSTDQQGAVHETWGRPSVAMDSLSFNSLRSIGSHPCRRCRVQGCRQTGVECRHAHALYAGASPGNASDMRPSQRPASQPFSTNYYQARVAIDYHLHALFFTIDYACTAGNASPFSLCAFLFLLVGFQHSHGVVQV